MSHWDHTEKAPLDTAPYLNKWVTQDVSYMTRDLLIYAQGIGTFFFSSSKQ
jgi:hypothetical protein